MVKKRTSAPMARLVTQWRQRVNRKRASHDPSHSRLDVLVNTPQMGMIVEQPFAVAGWTIDLAAADRSSVDTVHVWAYPTTGGDPIFLGVAAHDGSSADVAATYVAQFKNSSYNVIADRLPRGTYDVVVYPHRAVTATFNGAQVVRVAVR
jgi:hypothetical protein